MLSRTGLLIISGVVPLLVAGALIVDDPAEEPIG